MDEAAREVAAPGEREALRFWLRLGCIGFGGPAGQIAIMHDELVERRRWIDEPRFLHALNFCMALPGPEAQQLATYIGHSLHGVRGGLAAGGLFVLPSFVLLCVLSGIYVEYGEVDAVAGIVRGLGAAVVGLVVAAVLRIGGRVVRTPAAAALALAAFGLIVAGVPFPAIVVVAAGAGLAARRFRPGALGRPRGHGDGPAATPPPATPGRLRRVAVRSLLAWLVPVAALLAVGGLVADLAGFFTLTALVTFGGAYAVLPFVADQAVHRFGWLTPSDMVAGLALGESTPGPLIMVNTFVGFVAGYRLEGGLAWGVIGASVATFCTFAPSFVFILVGAPLIDRVRAAGPLADALHGITVGVVGVVLGLAVFVARHALVVDGRPDALLVVVAIATFIAVWRLRVGVVKVVLAAAAVGLVETLV